MHKTIEWLHFHNITKNNHGYSVKLAILLNKNVIYVIFVTVNMTNTHVFLQT